MEDAATAEGVPLMGGVATRLCSYTYLVKRPCRGVLTRDGNDMLGPRPLLGGTPPVCMRMRMSVLIIWTW